MVDYLRNEDLPQFFNSLTVALLPIKDNEVLEAYSGTHWAAPGDLDGSVTPYNVDVGAISFSYYDKWNEPSEMAAKLGRIRWNPDEVFGVAIDGQHRLAAMKSSCRQTLEIGRPKQSACHSAGIRRKTG